MSHSPRHSDVPAHVPALAEVGVLAERVIVSTALDPYLSLKALAAYSGLSVRKLRDMITDPAYPLPYYRIGGKIIVRRSEYDACAAAYRRVGQPDVDRVVAQVIGDLHSGAPNPRLQGP